MLLLFSQFGTLLRIAQIWAPHDRPWKPTFLATCHVHGPDRWLKRSEMECKQEFSLGCDTVGCLTYMLGTGTSWPGGASQGYLGLSPTVSYPAFVICRA